MRIVSPVDTLAETGPLLEAGADELYGGFVPAEWAKAFGPLASINQRTFAAAQFDDFAAFAASVELTRAAGKRFSLTLNAPYYDDAQLPLILEFVETAVAAGISGVILADLGLIRLLHARFPDLELHASTLAHLMTAAAVNFYADLGIRRSVIPRHLSLAAMQELIAAAPRVHFDAFLLVGKCPNTEGLCTFHHSSPERVWPCEIPYAIEAETGTAGETLAAAIRRQSSWSTTDRRHGCGLCAIPQLAAIGVDGLKLVGRGAPARRKIAHVSLVRSLLDLAPTLSSDDYCNRAVAAHRANFGAGCSTNVCYYPELCRARD